MLWKETKDWRQHWKLSKFLQALFLGLAASIFDLATDFHFARSVEEDCGYGGNEVFNFSSPCGSVHFKNVERVTYTFIAFPGVLMGFATVHNIVRELIGKCWKQHALDFFPCLWSTSVLAL